MKQQEKVQAALKRLSRNQDFEYFLDQIRLMKEAAIGGMEGASTEKLHQIAGCLSVYQAILNNAEDFKRRTEEDAK